MATTTTALTANRYGKTKVRLLKVDKSSVGDAHAPHTIHDYSVHVLLEGDFADTYLTGDNSKVVPTDTVKNTVYIVAKKNTFSSPEEYSLVLADHFLRTYAWVSRVHVKVTAHLWDRISVPRPHEHSFVKSGGELRKSHVIASRDGATRIVAAVDNMVVLKTTASGFVGFNKDQYTTLNETTDRVFCTALSCKWSFNTHSFSSSSSSLRSIDFNKHWSVARDIFFSKFATEYSKSVQETLYITANAIIQACPQIDEVQIKMPNKHAFEFNLQPFGLTNNNTIFQPVEEPSGLIEGTVRRIPAKL